MKQIGIIFFFIFLVIDFAKSQQLTIKIVEVPDCINLKGKIDKYPINMDLYLYKKFNNLKGFGTKVFGTYYYQSSMKLIQLDGEIILGKNFSKEPYYIFGKVNLFELNENGERTAQFTGNLIDTTSFIGKWSKIQSTQELDFDLIITSLSPIHIGNKYILEIKSKKGVKHVDITEFFKYEPILESYVSFEQNDKLYSLIEIFYFTNGIGRETGNCGAGQEKFLIFVEQDDKLNSLKSQIIKINSCLDGIGYERIIDGLGLHDLEKLTSDFKLIKYIVDDYSENKTDIYVLSKDGLSNGFIVSSTNN